MEQVEGLALAAFAPKIDSAGWIHISPVVSKPLGASVFDDVLPVCFAVKCWLDFASTECAESAGCAKM